MDFFELQEHARRSTRWLLLLYLLAVAAIVLAVCAGIGATYTMSALYGFAPLAREVRFDGQHIVASYLGIMLHGVPPKVYLWSACLTLATIGAATAFKVSQLAGGGEAVAELLDARLIERGSSDPLERRLLNVVEEMAIASGIHVPPVYLLEGERGINAFAAGYAPNEAVVTVTRGALEQLTRDELQGVLGHEFSHILNGDMRLNVRLLGVLFGILFIGQAGQFMVRMSMLGSRGRQREDVSASAAMAVLGVILALIGALGLAFASMIKAAVSRQREFLADASSVQFTRNPDGIAGALDTIAAWPAGSRVGNLHAEELSHMFFAQALANWFGSLFDTHPPLDERIRRVRPGFERTRYRERRAAAIPAPAVAVLDGAGNVVKTIGGEAGGRATGAAGAASALAMLGSAFGTPMPQHVDYAAQLLGALPASLRERLVAPEGAAQVVCALALESDADARAKESALLGQRRGTAFAQAMLAAYAQTSALGRAHALPLLALAMPALRQLKQPERDALLADYEALIEADHRVTLHEFVLATLLRQSLREDAGRPIPMRYRSVDEIAADAHVVLSVVAYAAGGDTAQAFDKGAAALGLNLRAPLPAAELSTPRVAESLERLRLLAPLAKPRILKACVEAAGADGSFRVADVELVRAVAATLDCPLPPVIEALDPASLDT
ncbi:MAG TPA: M48 family metallopeptidase [Burkholderiales bacterium]|nr:M48 family metallopeptidase [Burkholderiales bacterium]